MHFRSNVQCYFSLNSLSLPNRRNNRIHRNIASSLSPRMSRRGSTDSSIYNQDRESTMSNERLEGQITSLHQDMTTLSAEVSTGCGNRFY